MGFDMLIYAYRLKEHDPQKLCLEWNRQMPEPLGDWMIVSALDQGATEVVARTKDLKNFDKGLRWPVPYDKENVWRAYNNHKNEICDTCRWFYDPSSESALILSKYDVHHSYGCSGSMMMSQWFIKNLYLGSSPVVREVPKWYDNISLDDEDLPMFVNTERNQGVREWTRQNIADERQNISNMGKPHHEIDIEAYDETMKVLEWAEAQIEGDGVRRLCIHDF